MEIEEKDREKVKGDRKIKRVKRERANGTEKREKGDGEKRDSEKG